MDFSVSCQCSNSQDCRDRLDFWLGISRALEKGEELRPVTG